MRVVNVLFRPSWSTCNILTPRTTFARKKIFNSFFLKVLLLGEFHGLQDDLNITWKTFIPWPLVHLEKTPSLQIRFLHRWFRDFLVKIMKKNRNFGQKAKFLSKIKLFVQNQNFCTKSKFLYKIKIVVQNQNFCPKSQFSSKI